MGTRLLTTSVRICYEVNSIKYMLKSKCGVKESKTSCSYYTTLVHNVK